MKEIKLGKYDSYPFEECDRCGERDQIRIRTEGGYNLCDWCARKMTFDREHLTD